MKITISFLSCCLLLSACASDPEGPAGPTEAEILERVAAFETSGEFTRVNAMPFPSQHAAAAVNIYVSSDALPMYLEIDPTDETDTSDPFPTGTIIIKELLNDAGARTALTLMVKGGEGGDPETADWWWGRIDESGNLGQSGSIGFCIDCHAANGLPRTDWLYGVPASNRR